MKKTPGEVEPPRQITKAEREARKAFRQVGAEKGKGVRVGVVMDDAVLTRHRQIYAR